MIDSRELAEQYFTRYGHPSMCVPAESRPWTEAMRVQLRRGQVLPPLTKKITRPSRWGNPFTVTEYGHAGAVERHRDWLSGEGPWVIRTPHPLDPDRYTATYDRARVLYELSALGGYDLACACKPEQPCHGDTLLALLNA